MDSKPIFNEDTLSEKPAIAHLRQLKYKCPVAQKTGLNKAVIQLERYRSEIPQLFNTTQMLIGVNLFGAKYGAIGAEPEHFHEWKEHNGEKFLNMGELISVHQKNGKHGHN